MSPSNSAPSAKVNELRDTGNNCVKNGNFAEAILHYTHAIKMDPKQYQLYSNRSHAFLKMQQLYFAHQDALMAIKLKPDWPKGYFRAGEVEFEAQQYKKAVDSYRKSLHLETNDYVMARLQAAQTECRKTDKSEAQMPWFGMAFGVLCGILIVVADQVITKTPVINNPIFQAVIIIMLSVTGHLIGIGYRYFMVSQRKSLLEPPPDLFNDGAANPFSNEESPRNEESKMAEQKKDNKHHYKKKSTARQRYQRGKS